MSRESIRAAVAGVYTDYVGQEGRGGARGVQHDVLAALEREWAAEDAADKRRTDILRDLRETLREGARSIAGLNAPEYVADHLAGYLSMFVLSLDGRTWEPPADPEPDTDDPSSLPESPHP